MSSSYLGKIVRLKRPPSYLQCFIQPNCRFVSIRRTGGPRPGDPIFNKALKQDSENERLMKQKVRSPPRPQLLLDRAPPNDTAMEDIKHEGFGMRTVLREPTYQAGPKRSSRGLKRKKRAAFRKPEDTTPIRVSKRGTALHWAVDPWKEEEARSLLDKQVIDINAKDTEGQTALHVLVTQDKPEAVQMLLDHGADVNAVDNEGITPLHCAVYFKSKTVLNVLLDAGADLEAQDDNMKTPLYAATRRNAVIPATILLDAGAQVDPPKGAKSSLIHFATRLKRKRILALLLDRARPASVNFKEPDGTTPLHIAAEQGQYVAVYMLVEKSADINAQDANGNTPLHLAAAEVKTTALAVLCRLGANPRLKNHDGMMPDEDVVRKYEHKQIKGLPGLERLNENKYQRRARERLEAKMLRIRDSKKMGDGDNWDDQVDFAKARRTKLRRFHVKEHLSAKFEKKRQAKIVGRKGKKFHHWESRGQIGAGGIYKPSGRSIGLIFPSPSTSKRQQSIQ